MEENRPRILDIYRASSVFTLTIDEGTFPIPTNDKQWIDYKKRNLNLEQNNDTRRVGNSLIINNNNICDYLTNSFPLVKHLIKNTDTAFIKIPFDSPTGTGTTQCDGLVIKVYGRMLEKLTGIQRAFTRELLVVVLTSSPIGFVVLNDHLTLFPVYERSRPQRSNPSSSSPSLSSQVTPIPVSPPNPQTVNLSPDQQQEVQHFCQVTRLKPAFAFDCLSRSGWDLSKANQLFQETNAAGKLGADCFQ